MTRSRRLLWAGLFVAAVYVVAVRWQFSRDLALATVRAATGSVMVTTRCGPIEVASLRPAFADFLGVDGRRPDLVVRFGRGPTLPPSLRRPLQAVLV